MWKHSFAEKQIMATGVERKWQSGRRQEIDEYIGECITKANPNSNIPGKQESLNFMSSWNQWGLKPGMLVKKKKAWSSKVSGLGSGRAWRH